MNVVKSGFRLCSLAFVLCVLVGCNSELYTGLTEQEANEMLAILMKNGIDAAKEGGKKGLVNLTVKDSQMADAVLILKELGYPKPVYVKPSDIFTGDGLISSPIEEKARYVYAISQDLAETVSQIDGVITSRVHVVLPELDASGVEIAPSSASVFIKYANDVNLQALVPKIKLLINNSIRGLNYDRITVTLVPSRAISADGVLQGGGQSKGKKEDRKQLLMIAGLCVLILVSVGLNAFLFLRSKK